MLVAGDRPSAGETVTAANDTAATDDGTGVSASLLSISISISIELSSRGIDGTPCSCAGAAPRIWFADTPRMLDADFLPDDARAALIAFGISTTFWVPPPRRFVERSARIAWVSVCAGSICRMILQTAIALSSRPSAA